MAGNEIIIDLGGALNTAVSMGRNLSNMKSLYDEISEIMASDISQHFEDEEGPEGTPWKELSPATIKQRKKSGHWPGKKLQVQSRGSGLLGSIQPQSTGSSASATTNKVYAAAQHFGLGARSSLKSGRQMPALPARPFMYLGADAKEEAKDATIHHITKK